MQISLLAERGVVEYDEDFEDPHGRRWDEKRVAEEIEDIGFDAAVVEKSEVQEVELRVYGYVLAAFAGIATHQFRLDGTSLVEPLQVAALGLAGVHSASLPFPPYPPYPIPLDRAHLPPLHRRLPHRIAPPTHLPADLRPRTTTSSPHCKSSRRRRFGNAHSCDLRPSPFQISSSG